MRLSRSLAAAADSVEIRFSAHVESTFVIAVHGTVEYWHSVQRPVIRSYLIYLLTGIRPYLVFKCTSFGDQRELWHPVMITRHAV